MSKTIVVLGGAYGGVHVAHYLLKHVKDIKIVLVSKNSHFYWNMASVRAIVQGTLKNEDFLVPLEKALEKYGKDKAELVIGTATAVDTAANTVKVATADGGERTIAYDQLVLATGARTAEADMPWKASGSYEELTALLDGVREKVAKAKHIVVAGAGSTGVEAASELGFAHGKDKEIVLLCSGDKLLAGDSLASNAAAELKKLNVTVKYNAYVESATALPDGKTEIVLAGASGDDAKITTDLYLPTMGLAPNSDYLDAKFLNDKKYVVVDDVYRVKGLDNVWALGDVVSLPRAGFMITKTQAGGVGKNIQLVLAGKQPQTVKQLPVDAFIVATGQKRGVGRIGPVKVFSALVYMAKGKSLGTNMFPPYIDGSVA